MTAQIIQRLDEKTINQIAAGEVIEDPASVIKELIENALDSGATSITLETHAAGRGLIRLSDNGCGMCKEDLLLCLERHATSKFLSLEDFNSLGTLGFRGEALPSIASISRLSIHTATENEGQILYTEGGRFIKMHPLPRQRGTTVTVEGLFFNVPVRRKFQKSIGSDSVNIHKLLTKMILCNESIGFTWIANGEEQFSFQPNGDLKERMGVLLGKGMIHSMLSVKDENELFQISGFCSKPTLHRANRTGQYLFINGRAVISSFISHKILEAYGTRLSKGRHPLFVLHLQIPSTLVDVNVHPQKKEIRLSDEDSLGAFLLDAIERVFRPNVQATVSLPPLKFSESATSYHPASSIPFTEETTLPLLSPRRTIIAKVGRYLLVEDPEGIRVIDQAAAHFRITYEHLVHKKQQKSVQTLLIPLQIEVSQAEGALIMESQIFFEEAGISIRPFGEHTFIIDAIPSFLDNEEVVAFVHAFLEHGALPKKKQIAKALYQTLKQSSKGASELIVEQLFACIESDYTPEGKRIHYLLTEQQLAKL